MHGSATQFNPGGGIEGDAEQVAYQVPRMAELLDISPRYAWHLVHTGQIESFKIGASRRVSRAALLAYVEKQAAA